MLLRIGTLLLAWNLVSGVAGEIWCVGGDCSGFYDQAPLDSRASVEFSFEGCTISNLSSWSSVIVSAVSMTRAVPPECDHEHLDICQKSCYDNNETGLSSSATSQCGPPVNHAAYWMICGHASTFSVGSTSRIVAGPFPGACGKEEIPPGGVVGGVTSVFLGYSISGNCSSWSAEYEIVLVNNYDSVYWATPLLRRDAYVVSLNGTIEAVAGVVAANGNFAPINTTYDSQLGAWVASPVISGGLGSQALWTQQISVEDSYFDVNEDGRFNGLDPVALGSAAYDERWDFDSDEDIDQDDIDFMQQIVDAGLHSGGLGDFDSDGAATCSDLDGIDDEFGYVLGQASYRVELDDNLDGMTDDWDRHWVYQAVHPGDIDADGDVDFSDLTALYAAYGTSEGDQDFNPYADVDRDGDVDFADQTELLAHYNDSCE